MQEFPSKTASLAAKRKQGSGHFHLAALLCLLAALLNACDQGQSLGKPEPYSGNLKAKNLQQMQVLHIKPGECAAVLRDNLAGHGLTIHQSGPADASLRLQLSNKRPLRQHLPIIETLGWQAHYRADVLGADNRILLSMLGQEGSLSMNELCDDIGDEIANKLQDYLPQE